jgi:hypothetical protein
MTTRPRASSYKKLADHTDWPTVASIAGTPRATWGEDRQPPRAAAFEKVLARL